MDKKCGPRIKLDNKKLKALFSVMLQAPTPKYIAYALGISKVDTVRSYIASGNALIEKFEEELEPLDDIIPNEFELVFEGRQEEFDAEFRILYGLESDAQIPDRLNFKYEQFILNSKRKFVEGHIERKEKEILDTIKLSDNKELDEQYKLLIRFARIYTRGKCVVEMGLLNSINKHSATAKNVSLGFKLLQTYNKEDFGEEQTIRHEGSIDFNNKSILSLAINWEKEQKEKAKMLEQKNNNIIDVTPTKLIEVKNEDE